MIPPFLDGRNDGTSITWEQSFGYSVSVQKPSILKNVLWKNIHPLNSLISKPTG